MKLIYKIIRTLLVSILLLALLVPAGIYVTLSLPPIQKKICGIAQRELSSYLNTDVRIDEVGIMPFNRVTLRRVLIEDAKGDTAVAIRRLGAGINLYNLVLRRKIVINYAEIIGLDLRLSRDSANAPLNIDPIIKALSPKNTNKPPTPFDFRVNTIVIRTSAVSYDQLDAPPPGQRFDPKHVSVTDLRADLRLPSMKNDNFDIDLRRLALHERSGLVLDGLEGMFKISSDGSAIKRLTIDMPGSHLAFNDITLSYDSWNSIADDLKRSQLHIEILPGSYIAASDAYPFVPILKDLDAKIKVGLEAYGMLDDFSIERFDLATDDDNIWLRGEGRIKGLTKGSDSLSISVPTISVGGYGTDVAEIAGHLISPSSDVKRLLTNLGHFNFLAHGEWSKRNTSLKSAITTMPGTLDIIFDMQPTRNGQHMTGHVATENFSMTRLAEASSFAAYGIDELSLDAGFDMVVTDRKPSGNAQLYIPSATFRNNTYTGLKADLTFDGNHYELVSEVDNPGLSFGLDADADIGNREKSLNLDLKLNELNPKMLGMTDKYDGHILSATLAASLRGSDIDDLNGYVDISGFNYTNRFNEGLRLKQIHADAVSDSTKKQIDLTSDILDATLSGNYRFATMATAVTELAASVLPSLFPGTAQRTAPSTETQNDFTLTATIKDSAPLASILKLPVKVIYPVDIRVGVDRPDGTMKLEIDAPYLQQKDKLVENTALRMSIVSDSVNPSRGELYFTTMYPTKKGAMTLSLEGLAGNDRIDTDLAWKVARDRQFFGNINMTGVLDRDSTENRLDAKIYMNPSKLVFNDTTWTVSPSTIEFKKDLITVDEFKIGRNGQYLSIDGQASGNPADSLMIKLMDVNLDYIFETLDIGNAMFGGIATGTFHAKNLFTQSPILFTDGLFVRNLKYNHSLMGDTRILSSWDAEKRAIDIKATINQPNGRQSHIDGAIMPLNDSLDFKFDANKIEIGFMKPFMEAFTSDIHGYASGKARLWGSFKYIDMTGDIFAENIKMKLDFTNTYYEATDSIHLEPGYIDLDNITLRDPYGHTAKLNGWVRHEFFKKPRFTFNITNADNLLVYDVKESPENIWYGRIFGNGSASVTGVPGHIDIKVDISTSPNSTFTFVLSDAEQAYDYKFITFRDREQHLKDSVNADHTTPAIVRELRKSIARSEEGGGESVYDLDITAHVNPNALVTIVMDPIGGDRIRSRGNGTLNLIYNSANENVDMRGSYILEHGSYNFTFQDIIIKVFTIQPGSLISFYGDPYAAQLDINAAYSLYANLSDLDESFLDDRELTRTNVPVNAILKVTGDMRLPETSYDISFPTLKQDVYRKVRSIISTEDMMVRQIFYLLALNRFYTPDYMNTTKGNELMSVASSTLSSQLGSILGELSDNWSISPNIRSDRGDFSDVEVDLALSSSLLNNRLLFNGNFGYRDKSLNNNTFIGDFDIEYLLNRSGSIRLKAYNRYNDQNFYVKNALTTQGVGIMFKRDFDDLLSFLKPLKRKRKKEKKDSVKESVPDSISVAPDSAAAPNTAGDNPKSGE